MSELNNPLSILDNDSDFVLVPGGIKGHMKGIEASSADLYKVAPDKIRVLPGFNARVRTPSYIAHKNQIKASIMANGFFQDEPLSGYVAVEMQEGVKVTVLYVTDGHTRLEAALEAIAEGAELTHLPMVVSSKGADIRDLTLSLILKNAGRPLTALETALVCRRLAKYGMEEAVIAERTGFTLTYVRDLLTLSAAPNEVREMVEDGTVAPTLAIEYMRKHGNMVVSELKAALGRAQAAGKSKVTKRFSGDAQFKSFVRKSGSELVGALETVKQDSAFASLSAETRKLIEDLVIKATQARAQTDATDGAGVAGDEPAAQVQGAGATKEGAGSKSEDQLQAEAIAALASTVPVSGGVPSSPEAEPEFLGA